MTFYLLVTKQEMNSRKSVRWSVVPVPCLSRLWLKLRGEQGSGPEGVDDLCFHTYGEFSPPPPPPPPPYVRSSPPDSNPSPNFSLKAQLLASRFNSQPQGEGGGGGEGGGENSPYV